MNAVHPVMQAALAPFAPPNAFTESQLLDADRHYQWLKTSGELERRRIEQAIKLEQQHSNAAWGWAA